MWTVGSAVGVKGKCVSSGKLVGIVNVYGPGETRDKIRLWCLILEKLQKSIITVVLCW